MIRMGVRRYSLSSLDRLLCTQLARSVYLYENKWIKWTRKDVQRINKNPRLVYRGSPVANSI